MDFAPNSLSHLLRLKHVYYERTLDSKSVLRDVELKASKLKRSSNTLNSSEATPHYHVPSKSACSNCITANNVCDGIKPYCSRCVKTNKQTTCFLKARKRVKKLEANLTIFKPLSEASVIEGGVNSIASASNSVTIESAVPAIDEADVKQELAVVGVVDVAEPVELDIDMEMEEIMKGLQEEERKQSNESNDPSIDYMFL